MIILADRWNLDTKKLSDLLGENISVMRDETKLSDNVRKVLNSDIDIDRYPLDFSKENEQQICYWQLVLSRDEDENGIVHPEAF